MTDSTILILEIRSEIFSIFFIIYFQGCIQPALNVSSDHFFEKTIQ